MSNEAALLNISTHTGSKTVPMCQRVENAFEDLKVAQVSIIWKSAPCNRIELKIKRKIWFGSIASENAVTYNKHKILWIDLPSLNQTDSSMKSICVNLFCLHV